MAVQGIACRRDILFALPSFPKSMSTLTSYVSLPRVTCMSKEKIQKMVARNIGF
jgi:hypothetical protein